MKYERLTNKNEEWKYSFVDDDEVYIRLQELEDKIENGTLIELQCKVGDTLYSISFQYANIFAHRVKDIKVVAVSENELCDHIETDLTWLWGTNVFLSKEEAEKHKAVREANAKIIAEQLRKNFEKVEK